MLDIDGVSPVTELLRVVGGRQNFLLPLLLEI